MISLYRYTWRNLLRTFTFKEKENRMSFLKNIIKQYPYQSFLMIWNLGIFSSLKTIASNIFGEINTTNVPSFITNLTGISTADVMNFFQTSPYRWLAVTIFITLLYRIVGGVLRLIFNVIIWGGSLYLLNLYLQARGIDIFSNLFNLIGGVSN